MAKYQVIIGRAENIDIVGTALGVPAKVDTGAFRSSIHASDVKEVTSASGDKILKFNILGHKCAPIKRPVEASRYDVIMVKSSNGDVEKRYEVTLKIKIGSKIFNTSFTLADRASNVFPILIGRKALKGRFIVDPARASVNRIELRRDFGLSGPESEEDLEE